MSKYQIKTISLKDANEYVAQYHRHHDPVIKHKFSLSIIDKDNKIVGIAIIGRPRARMIDDGLTLEVYRTCTQGEKNINSMLYGACARAAKELGYKRIITYTLIDELGTSLKAAGWIQTAKSKGGSWSRKGRPRKDHHPLGPKKRWERIVNTDL